MSISLTSATAISPGLLASLILAATDTSGSGVAFSQWFSPSTNEVIDLLATGTFSVCTVTHQVSADGGVTWENGAEVGMDFAAQPTNSIYCPFGLVHRFGLTCLLPAS